MIFIWLCDLPKFLLHGGLLESKITYEKVGFLSGSTCRNKYCIVRVRGKLAIHEYVEMYRINLKLHTNLHAYNEWFTVSCVL